MIKALLKAWLAAARHPKEINWHYSQEGEDIFLKKYYQGKSDGFFLDVGAHHPARFSNTMLLYKAGWRGINIDPLPGTKARFQAVRPRDITLEIAVGKPGTHIYHTFAEPAINTLNAENAKKCEAEGWTKTGEIVLTVKPLHQILDELAPLPPIDLMNIDAEGHDYEILQSNNWTKYNPRLILVEIQDTDIPGVLSSPTCKLLNEHNYTLLAKFRQTAVFEKTS